MFVRAIESSGRLFVIRSETEKVLCQAEDTQKITQVVRCSIAAKCMGRG